MSVVVDKVMQNVSAGKDGYQSYGALLSALAENKDKPGVLMQIAYSVSESPKDWNDGYWNKTEVFNAPPGPKNPAEVINERKMETNANLRYDADQPYVIGGPSKAEDDAKVAADLKAKADAKAKADTAAKTKAQYDAEVKAGKHFPK